MNLKVETLKEKEKALNDFINTVTDYARKNHLTMEVIDQGIEKVREAFYTDGLISKGVEKPEVMNCNIQIADMTKEKLDEIIKSLRLIKDRPSC